jgi:hypothetical protein
MKTVYILAVALSLALVFAISNAEVVTGPMCSMVDHRNVMLQHFSVFGKEIYTKEIYECDKLDILN